MNKFFRRTADVFKKTVGFDGFLFFGLVCARQESDLRPSGPEPDALSTELRAQFFETLKRFSHRRRIFTRRILFEIAFF